MRFLRVCGMCVSVVAQFRYLKKERKESKIGNLIPIAYSLALLCSSGLLSDWIIYHWWSSGESPVSRLTCHSFFPSFLKDLFILISFRLLLLQTHYAFLIQMKSISEPTLGINLSHKFPIETLLA